MNKPYGLWIDPKGNCWDVPDFMGHEEIAPQITGELFARIDEDAMPYSRYLLSSGFARVIYERNFISIESYRKLTRCQLEMIEIENEEMIENPKYELKEYSFLDFICHAHFHYNFVPLREFVFIEQ